MNAVALLRELVAIDSTSARSNQPVLDVLERHARALGFQTRRQSYRDKANLICNRGGEQGGLALVGHTDCVPFDAAWEGALRPEERDGKLYGRGSADTKAFLAAALAAASRTSRGPLQLVFTADEEIGCLGARKLQEEGALRPRYAIVGEPTRLIPVLGHKGYCLAEVIVRGAEGHSAYPETGRSAIFAAGRMLGAIERVGVELQADRDEQFSPPYTTLNVGLISGGKAKNVIPGACSFTLEWRPLPSQEPEHVLRQIQALGMGEVAVQRLDRGILQSRNSSLVEFLRAQTGNEPETIPFGTELPYLAALGAEACVFGPGDIRVAHRTGEFVPLDQLQKAVDILTAAIDRFGA
ncbi:MAG TPA: acetylornithine deacetylase [Myxococcales bacterium]|nr:acetylornithine deacetylase [Myxococcales bacterium]